MELSDFKVVFDGPRDARSVGYHFPSHWVVQYLFTIEKDGEYVDMFVDFDSTLPTDFKAWRPYLHWFQNGQRFSRSTNEDSYTDRQADVYFQLAKKYFQEMWWMCFQDHRRIYSGSAANAAMAVQPYLKEK